MSRVRDFLGGGAVVGILVYTIALYNGSALFVNLPRIIGAFSSIILFLFFAWLLVIAFKWFNDDRDHFKVDVWKFVVMIGAFALLLIELLVVFDWWFGHNIRAMLGLTHMLPSGFLVVASGRAGFIYMGLVIMGVVALFMGKRRKTSKKHSDDSSGSHPSTTTTTTHTPSHRETGPQSQFVGAP